ncbi:MAG: SpoIID/LytB domain-containing protein [Lachnospiraceae bacterium]|nr:SpoIID/LytB domain-containing protein [Lachnospiraceae bacterium]
MKSRKKSKKNVFRKRVAVAWVIGVPLVVAALIAVILLHEKEGEGINRGLAAKSVVLALQSPQELETWQKSYRASHFPAKELEQWYVPYLDYLYEKGFLSEEDTPAKGEYAEGYLTYGEAAQIAGCLSPQLKSRVSVTKRNRAKPYPQELWWLLYDSILKSVNTEERVEKRNICIYGTVKNVPGTPAWIAHTNLGETGFAGLAMDGYIDHELEVYLRGNEIIHVLSDKGQELTYQNVWLMDGDEEGLRVYVGDIERQLPFAKKTKKVEKYLHNLADIQMENGKVIRVSVKKERITGKLLSVQPDGVEIEGYGVVPLDEEYKVLKTYGGLERQKLEDLLIGYDIQEFVAAKGKICGILTVREFDAKTIRVLLMNEGFNGLYHEEITLSGDTALTLTRKDQVTQVAAGETVTFGRGDERLAGERVIVTADDGGEIRVCSLNRSGSQPSYKGRLELLDTEEGLVLINELYLEDYLKKVIPSEMPPAYEKEALKAQAVCARTYAYMQIQSNSYSQYGAHVDDSTNFQVYNNMSADERTNTAVDETYGKMLLYEGKPVTTYYFSTSCGITADSGVWGSDPASTPYLKSVTLQPGRRHLDLDSNDEFAAFIKRMDYPAYDSAFPFYRWNVTTNADILTANIGGVGNVETVRVVERGSGGVAQALQVKGSDGERTISGQDRIRAALGDGSLTINQKDGKTVTGWKSLPSGFLTVEAAGTDKNGVQLFKIYGGGYGHGVGMSQNGAQGMAKEGMGYEEILKFFYDGVVVETYGYSQ